MKKAHPVLADISSQLIFSITFTAALLAGLYFWSWVVAAAVVVFGVALGVGVEKLLNPSRSHNSD